jgi:AcrR family transcriptional regulator
MNPLERNKSSYHHGNLYAACVSAAELFIRKNGAESLSLRELAKDLNVSPAAPYRHFQTKDHLLAVVATNGFIELSREISALEVSKVQHSENILSAMGHVYLNFALRNKSRFFLMFGRVQLNREEHLDLKKAEDITFSLFLKILTQAFPLTEQMVERGIFVWSTMHGFTSLLIDSKLKSRGITLKKSDALVEQFAKWLSMSLQHDPLH